MAHSRAGAASLLSLAGSALGVIILSGCGSSPITPVRVERALEATFANLVDLQALRLHLPPMPAPDFAVTAIYRKPLPGPNIGAGDWTCAMVWQGPNRQTLRDTYDLFVTTDGCYTAAAAGESLDGPTIRMPDRGDVENLLHTFEGCFDLR